MRTVWTARRTVTGAVMAALVITAAAACGSSGTTASSSSSPTASSIKKGLTVYYIPKDTQNPYEVIADQGGQAALKALGGQVVVSSGTQDTAAALCPSLNQAAQAGVKIVAFDSDVNCGSTPSHLFINQANTQQIGTSEVDLLAKEIGSKGQIAILSAAASATNQNAWIVYMKQELKKYPNMKLVSTVYGNDDPATSLT